MSDYERGQLDFDEEDRLPWLEPAAEDEDEERISPLRLLGLIIAGLVVIGVVVGGIWWVNNRGGNGAGDEGELIAAANGSYKIPANEADAKKFEGEGDASFAASEGVSRDGKIDPNRVPETPISGHRTEPGKPAATATGKPAQSVSTPVKDATAGRPATPAARPAAGGATIQLGAYGSAAGAQEGWNRLAKRYAYLGGLAMKVESAEVNGGTVYRLRASGADAGTLCGRLKVAGEKCIEVN
ncbi:MAG: SPOR domain-containing protein [Sphingobium sp.]